MKWVETDKHSVADEMAALSALASFGLSVYPERCVRVRNRHSSCSRCADACTSGAISLEHGEWSMNPDLCVGCGTCATVCPTCALEAQHPNDTMLMASAMKSARACEGEAVFVCHRTMERHPDIDSDKVCQVVCLSRLEETLVATLFAQGVKRVAGVHADCANCPRHQGIKSAHLVKDTMSAICETWGIDARLVLTDELPSAALRDDGAFPASDDPDGIDLSAYVAAPDRDQAMAEGSSVSQVDGRIKASYVPAHVMKDGTLPHFVPSRRQRLLDQLATFGEPVADELDCRLWGHVVIDFNACKSCKMCAVFCPTGAICKYRDENGVAGIEHYVAECVHCGLCQDICPAGAIKSVTQVPAKQLAHGETERYCMPDPEWWTGPDQILRRMRPQISGNSVSHSY
ncbi:NADH-plastoquinone oxidoreductase subunit [Slackia heliotrinireducens]|uniref:NADH:ubiquinone oxidoreductase chain I-like protein n=1 Tax=Slackia heliotrinireducens (strain ATCC 29202 / DSM 20476 / NCTC 11029 / RHS 1) TaxID=471855 RepID=C7N3T7_SLAHD|nr:4Fe-4S binding protein [Slackia heliotrinireducens]ACV21678.1 NADH:ubiquinone oxidoreductase chain I-like protein [Slackia heliotrinireducens DSM 20476]VEG99297.1 NADH-plastoquinone oxidoreductase subunit [Slackia heliotrinireducens]